MNKEKKMSGKPPSFIDYNLMMYGEMDPDCPTNGRTEEDISQRLAALKVTLQGTGVIIVAGTGGSMDRKGDDFKNLWNDNG